MPLPKGMLAPTLPLYERADYWADRKTEYAAAAAAHRGKQPSAPADPNSHDDGDPGMDDLPEPDDDLPF